MTVQVHQVLLHSHITAITVTVNPHDISITAPAGSAIMFMFLSLTQGQTVLYTGGFGYDSREVPHIGEVICHPLGKGTLMVSGGTTGA